MTRATPDPRGVVEDGSVTRPADEQARWTSAIAVHDMVRSRDEPSLDLERERFSWGSFLCGYASALRARSYRWLRVPRVLFIFGYSTSTVLNLYMLQSSVAPASSAEQASAITPILGVVGIPVTLLAVAVSGRLSDRAGRRKLVAFTTLTVMPIRERRAVDA